MDLNLKKHSYHLNAGKIAITVPPNTKTSKARMPASSLLTKQITEAMVRETKPNNPYGE